MSKSVFNRGDIIRVTLNPVSGRELQGDYRPCLVLSSSRFNRLGTTLIAPITQGGSIASEFGFAIPLQGSGTETQGVVLVNHCRMMDVRPRKAQRIERVPDRIIIEALARLAAIVEYDG